MCVRCFDPRETKARVSRHLRKAALRKTGASTALSARLGGIPIQKMIPGIRMNGTGPSICLGYRDERSEGDGAATMIFPLRSDTEKGVATVTAVASQRREEADHEQPVAFTTRRGYHIRARARNMLQSLPNPRKIFAARALDPVSALRNGLENRRRLARRWTIYRGKREKAAKL